MSSLLYRPDMTLTLILSLRERKENLHRRYEWIRREVIRNG